MARIPYADPDQTRSGHPDLVARIIHERGGMIHLYAMLLQSPPMAEGWLDLLTAVRQKSSLPAGLRELLIIRVAQINGAPYEAEQHRPIALREGVSAQALDALEAWRSSDLFTDAERAALELCDGMTSDIHVAPALIAAASDHFTPREVVELAITVGAYNMVSRVLEALQISASDEMGSWD